MVESRWIAEFIKGIALFSVKGDRQKKLECALSHHTHEHALNYMPIAVAFKIYDIDGDGFISNGELFQVLKLMVGSNLKETQLQQVAWHRIATHHISSTRADCGQDHPVHGQGQRRQDILCRVLRGAWHMYARMLPLKCDLGC